MKGGNNMIVHNFESAAQVVWVPAPSQEEEGSGTLRTSDLFFTPHGYRGATIECESVIHTYCDEYLRKCVHSIAIPIPIIRVQLVRSNG